MANVSAKQKKKFKVTTDSKHKLPVTPNVLARNFAVSGPDIAYCANITYIWTAEGWLYLAVVIDLYSRKVVGWALSHRMTKDQLISALQMAIWRRSPMPGLIFHSDGGSQYCSNDFLYPTRQAAKNDIIDYIEMFYNSRRRHSYLGYFCSNEFEKLMELKEAA